jgi:hypothetical protein
MKPIRKQLTRNKGTAEEKSPVYWSCSEILHTVHL